MPKRKRKEEEEEDEEPKNNDVKYKGVIKEGKRYRARIRIDGTLKRLGLFDTPKEAATAHDRVRIEERHPTSKMNFLDQVPKNYKPKKKKLRSDNTIGYRGVTKRNNRFEARIRIEGKNKTIGYFGTKKEAALAFDKQNVLYQI